MIAAAGTCFSPRWPQALAASTTDSGPQPLAAPIDDVLGDLVDQRDIAGQPLDDRAVDALQVVRDQRPDFFELHSRDKPPVSG